MDADQFWQLIDATRGQPERGDMLTAALATLPEDAILRFRLLYDDVLQTANTWDLWGAAYQINGGCSDDGFYYFREGLLELGRKTFEDAVADPDGLAAVVHPPDEVQGTENLSGCAAAAWMARTEKSEEDFFTAADEVDDRTDRGAGELGERWNFKDADEVRHRLPRLAAMYLKDEEE